MSPSEGSFIVARPDVLIRRPHFLASKRTCRRSRSNWCSAAQDSRRPANKPEHPKNDNIVNGEDTHENSYGFDEHAPDAHVTPLGARPSEAFEFDGWDEIDDDYWHDVRKRELAFRAPDLISTQDFEGPQHPLDRYGNPSTYPAAVKYDDKLQAWVPTTEEEEEKLRQPYPVKDPYSILEAKEGETYTNLKRHIDNFVSNEYIQDDDETEFDVTDPRMYTRRIKDVSKFRRRPLGIGPGDWKVVHLGTSSAIPTRTRNVSSTAVVINPSSAREGTEPSMFLVDVGENTSARLIGCPWCLTHGYRWIKAIFITHLHGDHIFGLPSLLAKIGRYAQHRRRKALENGEQDTEPVIRIFGPYGIRGFLRTSLYWTNPVGVRFSVSELVPRSSDFLHIRGNTTPGNQVFVQDCGSTEVRRGSGVNVNEEAPPPHPEEVRAEDIHASDDGLWHVWKEINEDMKFEVVSAPLRHRMPCFGYVFRELEGETTDELGEETKNTDVSASNGVQSSEIGEGFEIDKEKAKKLGVYGSQFRVLRSGRPVTISKTGLVVKPADVAPEIADEQVKRDWTEEKHVDTPRKRLKKVTVLGDTCNSSMIADAAMDSDLLIHEATFNESLRDKARIAMHSTARMAGAFGKQIRAKKLALTHFSSRYEFLDLIAENTPASKSKNESDKDVFDLGTNEEEDLASPNSLVSEAKGGWGKGPCEIIAAYDFLEHNIVSVDINAGESTENDGAEGKGLKQTSLS